MYEPRPIRTSDIDKGYLDLLDQLSETHLTREHGAIILTDMIGDPNIDIFVVEYKGKIIGCVTSLYEQKLIHGGASVCHCEDLIVDKEYRGQSISHILINHQLKQAKKNGCYKMVLSCNDYVADIHEYLGGYRHENSIRYDL